MVKGQKPITFRTKDAKKDHELSIKAERKKEATEKKQHLQQIMIHGGKVPKAISKLSGAEGILRSTPIPQIELVPDKTYTELEFEELQNFMTLLKESNYSENPESFTWPKKWNPKLPLSYLLNNLELYQIYQNELSTANFPEDQLTIVIDENKARKDTLRTEDVFDVYDKKKRFWLLFPDNGLFENPSRDRAHGRVWKILINSLFLEPRYHTVICIPTESRCNTVNAKEFMCFQKPANGRKCDEIEVAYICGTKTNLAIEGNSDEAALRRMTSLPKGFADLLENEDGAPLTAADIHKANLFRLAGKNGELLDTREGAMSRKFVSQMHNMYMNYYYNHCLTNNSAKAGAESEENLNVYDETWLWNNCGKAIDLMNRPMQPANKGLCKEVAIIAAVIGLNGKIQFPLFKNNNFGHLSLEETFRGQNIACKILKKKNITREFGRHGSLNLLVELKDGDILHMSYCVANYEGATYFNGWMKDPILCENLTSWVFMRDVEGNVTTFTTVKFHQLLKINN